MNKPLLNTIESALEVIKTHFNSQYNVIEQVDLESSFHRVLAEDIVSTEKIPAFAKSTVDGYAVKFNGMPCVKLLSGKVDIGNVNALKLDRNTCIYIPTGAMIPEGTDTMVMIEDTSKISDDQIRFNNPNLEKQNIIEAGDDMSIGEVILEKGTLITAHEIGALASMGMYSVKVLKKPRITIISTGSELCDKGDEITLGKIREVNTYTLAALSKEMGLDVINRKVLSDDYKLLEEEFKKSISESDLVVISGGSSVGEKDYTYPLLNSICDQGVLLNGIAIKPGKPTIIAQSGQKPIIGLPGHPVSSIVIFKLVIGALLNEWGFKVKPERHSNVILDKDIYPAKGRDTYQMVFIESDGKINIATPTSGKSGMISLLTKSNGYIIIPKENEIITKGTEVVGYYFY